MHKTRQRALQPPGGVVETASTRTLIAMSLQPSSPRRERHPEPATLPRSKVGELMRVDHTTAPRESLLDEVPASSTADSPRRSPTDHLSLPTEKVWRELRPRGLYAQLVRPLIEYSALLLALPLLLAVGLPIALANWIQFGSVRRILFAQERIGYRGKIFTIYKFRTMRDASESQHFDSWADGDEQKRVTRFGQFLRNSHLDELPQLLHVFAGQMSIIGPRPEMVEIENWVAIKQPEFVLRLAVRPGITGLGQVAQGYVGADETGYRRKHELAQRYLKDYGFRIDTYIVLKTLATMIALKGWNLKPFGESELEAHRPAASRTPKRTEHRQAEERRAA